MTAILEAYLWHSFDSVRSLKVSEDNITWYTYTIASASTVREALDYWETQANAEAGLAETYTFSWLESSGVVRLSATGTFYVEAPDSLGTALGFASGVLGPSAGFSSSSTPKVICAPVGVTYRAYEPLEDTAQDSFRRGRGSAVAFVHGSECEVRVRVDRDTADAIDTGPLFSGFIRAACDSTASSAYGLGSLDGYHDVYITGVDRVSPLGRGGHHVDFIVRGVAA